MGLVRRAMVGRGGGPIQYPMGSWVAPPVLGPTQGISMLKGIVTGIQNLARRRIHCLAKVRLPKSLKNLQMLFVRFECNLLMSNFFRENA